MRTMGLIPAAGQSRRMGQPKLLLPLGPSTVLEHVLAAVRASGILEILVAVAPGAEVLAQKARRAGAQVLQLPEDTPDMRATCLHGLAWMEQHWRPAPEDGWLLLPADHPTLYAEVIRQLLAQACAHPDQSILVPVHAGRRGHPTWLRWSHVESLRRLPAHLGLNSYIRQHASETLELSWPSAEILRDLDTPEDYQCLLDEYG